jgi:hypothetical protein
MAKNASSAAEVSPVLQIVIPFLCAGTGELLQFD